MLGNSSCALMEAPYYGVPAVDIGSRQNNRVSLSCVINSPCQQTSMLRAIKRAKELEVEPCQEFGKGDSAKEFVRILSNPELWRCKGQKLFYDRVVAQ